MKKIAAGFLIVSCLFFSASARLPLLQQSGAVQSIKPTGSPCAKNLVGAKLSVRGKYFRRFFALGHGYFIPRVTKIVHTWASAGFLVFYIILFSSVYLFLADLRAPP